MKRLAYGAALVLAGCGWDVAPGAFCTTAVEVDGSSSGSLTGESTAIAADFEQYNGCAPAQPSKVYAMTVPPGKSLAVSVEPAGASVWLVRGDAEACDYASRYTCGQGSVSASTSTAAERVYVGVSLAPTTQYRLGWTVRDAPF